MFNLDGIYGRFNKITIIAYLVAVIAEVPFVNSSFYVGPLCKALNGADIS
jgi:nucleobase:cation symporter-1, NCS1 family